MSSGNWYVLFPIKVIVNEYIVIAGEKPQKLFCFYSLIDETTTVIDVSQRKWLQQFYLFTFKVKEGSS